MVAQCRQFNNLLKDKKIDLPKVIADLVKAQNNFDTVDYTDCFCETAIVFDDGKTHNGRKEIEYWIEDTNQQYKATMEPLSFEQQETVSILKAEVSGNFDGSPILMSYHLEITDKLIQSLKITA